MLGEGIYLWYFWKTHMGGQHLRLAQGESRKLFSSMGSSGLHSESLSSSFWFLQTKVWCFDFREVSCLYFDLLFRFERIWRWFESTPKYVSSQLCAILAFSSLKWTLSVSAQWVLVNQFFKGFLKILISIALLRTECLKFIHGKNCLCLFQALWQKHPAVKVRFWALSFELCLFSFESPRTNQFPSFRWDYLLAVSRSKLQIFSGPSFWY